jgi:hypothetical protein
MDIASTWKQMCKATPGSIDQVNLEYYSGIQLSHMPSSSACAGRAKRFEG